MSTYKAQLRIPTGEQYAYIEVTVEGTPEEVVAAYYEFTKFVKPGIGLSSKDFNTAIDRYLTDGTGETEKYLAMNPAQQACIQEIKKAFKRLEGKEGRIGT